MQIADNCVVSFHYTLTNDAGEVVDSSAGREPLSYLHGLGHIVPGLENALEGRSVGDAFRVDVPAAEGYGERHDGLTQVVPKQAFQGVDALEVGMQFQARGPSGVMSVVITAIEGDEVTVDGNHPLAGQDLHFDVEITEVRAATADELAHGHAHGPGGHDH